MSANEPNLFDGPAYDPATDNSRLKTQISRVYKLCSDRQWRTLNTISWKIDAPESSVGAQLRHLRKERFGAHTVNRRIVDGKPGLYEYQLIASECGLLDGQRVPPKPVCPACGGSGRASEHVELASANADRVQRHSDQPDHGGAGLG